MLNRTGVTAAVAGGAFVALAIAFVQVRGQNRETQDAMQRELREMREAMSALRSQVGHTQIAGKLERVELRGDDGSNVEETATEAKAASAASPDAPDSSEAKSFTEAMQRSEDAFRDEAIDAAWAGAATNQVQGTLAKLLPAGATLRGLSCHSTRCRLEMSLRDEASLDQFQRTALYGNEILWRGQMMLDHQKQPDGTIAMVAHLLREREQTP